MNTDIRINHNEYDDDPMSLLVQDGNGSITLTQSQKASLFDKIFDQSSLSPDRQEESEIRAEIQYVFESQGTNQPEMESCLQPDLSHNESPAEEPAEEAAEVPRLRPITRSTNSSQQGDRSRLNIQDKPGGSQRIDKSTRKETARARKDRKLIESRTHRKNLKAAKENLDGELNRLNGHEKRTMIGTLVTSFRILKESLVYEE